MGIGTATGKSKARDAALNAIQSLLLDIGFEQATGIVWKITGGSSLALFELSLSLSNPNPLACYVCTNLMLHHRGLNMVLVTLLLESTETSQMLMVV
ncbi:hypothetical protein GH714_000684 [Hevea brasiliensis]|uniref:Cell division protein FtsZ C-terminal domain-containing protein n=1 Tax=Hevea brasiliensis TaxID=3981 RepID=A0A6A6N618_HEVBR|nr:hypothetical protein GH714_000684 [Hevea brasiliensis]